MIFSNNMVSTLDTAPSVPFINGLLPVSPPVSFKLPIVLLRYDALTPPPLRLPPVPLYPPLPPTSSPTMDTSRVPMVMRYLPSPTSCGLL